MDKLILHASLHDINNNHFSKFPKTSIRIEKFSLQIRTNKYHIRFANSRIFFLSLYFHRTIYSI